MKSIETDGRLICYPTGRIDSTNAAAFEQELTQAQAAHPGLALVLDAEKLDCSFIAFCYIKMKQHTFENARRLMDAVQTMDEVGECYNISGDYDFLLKVYVSSMKEYQQFVLRILGELDCIGGLNSSFVMGEVKNTHAVPVR